MAWKSQKQAAWGNSPLGKKALGAAGVKEWNAASKGMKLPKKVKTVKRAPRPLRGVTDLL
jgi:hypothetical protein